MSNFDSHYLQKEATPVDGDLLQSADLVSDYEKDFSGAQSNFLFDAHKKTSSALVSSSLLVSDDESSFSDSFNSSLIKSPVNVSEREIDTTSASSPLFAARKYLHNRFNQAGSTSVDMPAGALDTEECEHVHTSSEKSFAAGVFGQSLSRRIFSKRGASASNAARAAATQAYVYGAQCADGTKEIDVGKEFENSSKGARKIATSTLAAPYRLARARQAHQLKTYPYKREKIAYKIQKNEQRLEYLRLKRARKLREVKAKQRILASKKAQMTQAAFIKRKKQLARAEKRFGLARFQEKFIARRIGSLKNHMKRVIKLLALTRFALFGRVLLFAPLIVGAFMGFLLLLTLIAGSMGAMHRANFEGMNEYESAVARFLIEKEIDPLHVAAIMGNIAAESEFDPGKIEAPHAAAGDGFGLCQWSFDRRRQLEEYAFSQGIPPANINVQLDFLYSELTGQGAAGLFSNVQMNFNTFLATDNLEQAVYYFGRAFERPNEAYAHWERRIEAAKRYYTILTMGAGGVLGGSDVISAAYSVAANATPYVFGGSDIVHGCDCSFFTQWCYAQAGISIPRTSEAQKAAGIAIPLDEAQAGDLVWMPGHIGIYISPTTVIEQTPPYCRVNSIHYNRWVCAIRILH